jgi:hypothetical protein
LAVSADRQSQTYGHVQGSTDAARLGRLPQLGELRLIERAGQNQLGVDGRNPSLRLGRRESRLEVVDRPLLAFGEPPNRRDLSGADGTQEHFRGRWPLVAAPGLNRRIEHDPMWPDRCLGLHSLYPLHRHASRHRILRGPYPGICLAS